MAAEVLQLRNIVIGQKTESKQRAIERVGQMLVDSGYVTPRYIGGMKKREEEFTTYIGGGIAIPHGVNEYKKEILSTGLAVVQYPQGVIFGKDKIAYLVIGIAGKGDEHLDLLTKIALTVQDTKNIECLRCAKTPQEILDIINEGSK
ncbi:MULTISPECIES: PTS sugar transporter subunit IIA [Caproicibacterium]|jgi:PTS system mannitol-specific IIA component|uniref:Mannitol-specific phosphotransferase enzyme IIA component n=1 Tax=Caproicibacterium lactatifermentans TaxID=2666138 RepID=A0A859DSH9_9FIRM|nr:PTS sugar transporter subunit IIA [Caproicibacterium lactatifermentans]ARP49481.1 PTS mannitol transporter subunit IIA [Ruminococcaceae bacterium CPB6]MDD4806881.1 PTS sugar transporter subunit IIA [Oscillospiraceae bacterium]QKN23073.1 PTS mannitol transporter subunit IIA [Caproicibacterium lactatifermentans]QKO30321.1 PTS mannitol transporter subunit IIA [Caproicibacterium lactatifermentans]